MFMLQNVVEGSEKYKRRGFHQDLEPRMLLRNDWIAVYAVIPANLAVISHAQID